MSLFLYALAAIPVLAAAQVPELIDEEARRARLREAGRQAEQLQRQLEGMEQQRLRQGYPQAPAPDPVPVEPPRAPGPCDGFSRDMEAVIREEMRGGNPAAMDALAARRQEIYLARLRAGC